MRSYLRSLLFIGLLLPLGISATTIIPYQNLGALVDASDAVVLVTASSPYSTTLAGCTHSDCDFTVQFSVKGPMQINDIIMLRRHSFYDDNGHLDVPGDFEPQPNHTYLVFLEQHDGGWRLKMLSYYVFEETFQQGSTYLRPVPESLNIGTFPRPDGQEAEPLATYNEQNLLQLLQQHAANPTIHWNPSTAKVAMAHYADVSERVLPTGCDFDLGTGLSRWQNQTINLYYDVTNAPADAAARFAAVISALNGSYGLNLVNGGSTDYMPTCVGGSAAGGNFTTYANSLNGNQTMILMFDDPCNEISDLSGCNGTLGIGGGYTFSSTHVFKGDTWFNATWGYAIINNGARACLSATDYERLLTHELTHALRMDHLSATLYPGNNMNPQCCNPINTKDQECMLYVYSTAAPVELTAFNAKATTDAVILNWSTEREVNNDHFILERSVDGVRFEQLTTVNASNLSRPANYIWADAQPLKGLSYYRLSQTDFDGKTEQLGIRAVTYRGVTGGYTLLPNPVNGSSIFLKSLTDDAAFESLQIFTPAGELVYRLSGSSEQSAQQTELPVGQLLPGVYWLQINGAGGPETLKFVKM